MFIKKLVPTPSMAVAVTALGLAVSGGGAYALAATTGSDSACVRHIGGNLYHASKCATHDARMTWAEVGPRGMQGIQGIQGPKGDPGAPGAPGTPGANGVVNVASDSNTGIVDFTSYEETVASKSLPAGKYLINAKTTLLATSTAAGSWTNTICWLLDGSSQLDYTGWSDTLSPYGSGFYEGIGTAELQGTVSLTAPATVSVSCYNEYSSGGATVTARASSLEAVPVDAIN